MSIDGFTFAAQVVNFLVLVLLLKRFLYRPVIEAVDRRRDRIDERVAEAEEARREARSQRREAVAERQRLEEERDRRMEQVEREVDEAREEMLAEAREDVGAAREQWRRSLRLERESFLAELRERAAREIHRGVRSVLAELADRDLERDAVRVLAGRLEEMDEVDREAFAAAVGRQGGDVEVRTRFEQPDPARDRLEAVLEETLGRSVDLRFLTTDEIGWGVELRAGDMKIGWSVESRLASLEEELGTLLEAEYREAAPAGLEAERTEIVSGSADGDD